jgi:hypothetical protein
MQRYMQRLMHMVFMGCFAIILIGVILFYPPIQSVQEPAYVMIFLAGNITGNMGGIAGADIFCGVSNGRVVHALLCTKDHSIELFPIYYKFNVSAPVFRDGKKIASNWLAFNALSTSQSVWSGCGGVLNTVGGSTCDDWTNSSAACGVSKELLCVSY